MTSDELRKKKMIDYVLKGFDRLQCELKGSTLSDEEFNEIALRASRFMQELYFNSANQTRTNKQAYSEALNALRKVRSIASSNIHSK